MAVLTTNNIETVGELDPLYTKGKEGQTREVVEDSDAFLIWDESASKHKKMAWGALNETFDEVVEEAELAEGAAAEAARAAQTAKNDAQTAAGTATTKASEASVDRGKAEAAALVSEGYAVGTQNETPAESGEPYFQDNAKYYKEQAEISASSASSSATSAGTSATAAASSASAAATSESNAATSETNAGTSETNAASSASDSEASALVSEGWAKGTQNGTAVASGDYFHNNAEWFKDQAAQSATDAASSASDASDSETAAATSETNAGVSESNALSYKNAAEAAANQARSYASIILMASGTVDQQKNVSLPAGGLLEGQIIRVMFPVGHNASGSAVYMTLNGNLVLSNQNGTLAPIPIHSMTEGGSTVYKVLDPNTTLEMYYTSDYDGQSTPAFIIIGNPIVLSSADYTIYADGYTDYFNYYNTGTVVYNYNNDVAVPQGGYTFSHEETVPSDGFYLLRCVVNNKSETTVASNSTKITMGGWIILEVGSFIGWSPSVDTIVIPLKKGTKLKFETKYNSEWVGKNINYSFFMLKLQ